MQTCVYNACVYVYMYKRATFVWCMHECVWGGGGRRGREKERERERERERE